MAQRLQRNDDKLAGGFKKLRETIVESERILDPKKETVALSLNLSNRIIDS